jgi:competence protein ComEA
VWTGSTGRGEQARVAARVRQLLAEDRSSLHAGVEPESGDRRGGSGSAELDRGWRSEPRLPGAERPEPAADRSHRRAVRWLPDSRGAAGLALAVLVAVVATLWWVLSARPHSQAVGPAVAITPEVSLSAPGATNPSTGAGSTSVVPSGSSAATVLVDVAGKVRRPGVYRLPAGSRVYQAIRVAGGARPGVSTTALNLAAAVTDGEQIVVGAHVPVQDAPPVVGTSAVGAGPIDLNTATLEQLESLPGVGPVLGQNILDWRNAHGHFASVGQLQQVPGIGDVRMAQLQPLVTI